jgi:hypothetical protein
MTKACRYKWVGGLLAVIAGICLCGLKFLNGLGGTPAVEADPKPLRSGETTEAATAASAYDAALTSAEIEAELNVLASRTDRASLRKFKALICRWAEMDESGAFNYVDSLASAELRRQGRQVLIELLARTDAIFVGERLLAETPPDAESIGLLANLWSQADARGALAWAERLQDGTGKDDALVSIRSQLAASDPVAASQMVTALPESSSTAALVVSVATHWGANDAQSALAWADSLPESEKALAIPTVVGGWAQRDPVAAASYVAQLPPGQMQDQATRSVVAAWAQQNPGATAAWVLQFPAGDLREQATRMVVSAWSSSDPSGIEDWAYHYPDRATRDTVLRDYVESIAYQTPDRAATVAQWINDSSEREQSLQALQRTNSTGSGF